eukprot:CAMPEP_0205828596 /NCGR_PEP_ID=MMETSP0206-20130828/35640_1 /ASSEMBLY_ACC=CAM_ASM_000279 /TAXON_ID=36767 /ORGANISM="Euplotes focardii, Strain TN1" /LENGTH=79 /DNA_ID=CAMNT_0053130593 /DNA_START=45 /DNA_END=280 /DNA_ORIENTATION=-
MASFSPAVKLSRKARRRTYLSNLGFSFMHKKHPAANPVRPRLTPRRTPSQCEPPPLANEGCHPLRLWNPVKLRVLFQGG